MALDTANMMPCRAVGACPTPTTCNTFGRCMDEPEMTGAELDRKLREVLMAATRSNVFSSVAALVDLGFPGVAAFKLISNFIIEKEARGIDS